MKNIILLTQFFVPESGAGAKRVYALAQSLRKYNLTVYTCIPSYPSPDLYNDIDIRKFDNTLGFEVIRLFKFNPQRRMLILRGLQEALMSLALMLKVLMNSKKCDVVIASSPNMFLIPISYVISKIKRAKMVLDIRDLTWRYAQEVIDISWFKRVILQIIEFLMLFCIRRADFVIGATHGLTEQLINNGIMVEKIKTIVNGVDEDFYNCFETMKNELHEIPIVSYIGLFGFNHGIKTILEVAKLLPQVEFNLYGDGPDKIELERKINLEGISNVKLLGYLITNKQLVQAYKDADILFCHIKDIPILNDIAVPAKLYEYMATGKPILYSGKGVAVDFLNMYKSAKTTSPDNPQEIADAIIYILKHYKKHLEMGQEARKVIRENFLRTKLFESLQKTIDTFESAT